MTVRTLGEGSAPRVQSPNKIQPHHTAREPLLHRVSEGGRSVFDVERQMKDRRWKCLRMLGMDEREVEGRGEC